MKVKYSGNRNVSGTLNVVQMSEQKVSELITSSIVPLQVTQGTVNYADSNFIFALRWYIAS